jgi:hypothetical protein
LVQAALVATVSIVGMHADHGIDVVMAMRDRNRIAVGLNRVDRTYRHYGPDSSRHGALDRSVDVGVQPGVRQMAMGVDERR